MKLAQWLNGAVLTACCVACGGSDDQGGTSDAVTAGTGGLGGGGNSAGTGGSANPGTGGSANPGTGGTANPSTGGTTSASGIVEVPGVACGSPLDPNFNPPFVELGGRRVFIDYACDKPVGTPVTFILNLHGTMDLEDGKAYIRGYFPAFNYTASHDVIVATPKSVVSQWGNGDNGVDEPHLMEVIDWVYANMSGFDIQQMWVVGHSWGAFYAKTFACKPELQDKVQGIVSMSGGADVPACSDRLALLGTVGETDIVPGELAQDATASAHGCAAKTTTNLGQDVITEWPSCDPGWVHKNYLMLGKGHGFDPVDWPDEAMALDLVEAIVSTR